MTTGRVTTKKGWDEIIRELQAELRMWRVTNYTLPYRGDSERRGEVVFTFKKGDNERTIRLGKFTREVNGMAKNLYAIKEAVKAVRLMDQRGLGDVLLDVAQVLALPEYDPYRVLGVDSTASWEEIRRAYRHQISQYHPDKMNGARHMYDIIERAAKDLGVGAGSA